VTAHADSAPGPALRDWAFAVYDRPGVQQACLELQDHHGMDVVVLLWCIWAGEHHGIIDAGVMERVVAETRAWQADIVAPLRAVRRRLKQTGAEASSGIGEPGVAAAPGMAETQQRLRSQVAETELVAEVIQLDRLEASTLASSAVGESQAVSVVGGRPGEAAVRANLTWLVSAGGLDPDPVRSAAIDALLTAVAGTRSCPAH
jgi:uncharacterized protein (TIGR02444 family)